MVNKHLKYIALLMMAIILIVTCCGCTKSKSYTAISAKELTKEQRDTVGDDISINETDYTKYISAAADFSIELFKRSMDSHDCSAISPVSVMISLGMTANGSEGETLAQIEQTLGKEAGIEELNDFYRYLIGCITSDNNNAKLLLANAIWINQTVEDYVQESFLDIVSESYDAQVYSTPFDNTTVKDVNNWTDYYTDGMIDNILDEIEDNDIIYLINAIAFDAQWEISYDESSISEGEFTDIDGNVRQVTMMNSDETVYIEGDNVTGFIKPYNGNYSFVALLPDKNTDIWEFVDGLDGQTFMGLVNNTKTMSVEARIPEFESSYGVNMTEPLESMGIIDAFTDKADLSKMVELSDTTTVEIDRILHKTYICVNPEGTKAASETLTAIDTKGVSSVYLDRPFVYAVIDDTTKLPVFIGTVTEI